MGRDWLDELLPDFLVLNSSPDSSLQNLLRKYADLFKEELGLAKGVTVKLQVDGKAQPRFYKPRTVPYALPSRVEELARLEKEGILEPVTHSEWAAPVIPVVKQDGSWLVITGKSFENFGDSFVQIGREDIKRAIMEVSVPQNVSQLRSFLHGLINFYGKFLQKKADNLALLHNLLWKQEKWQWGPSQEKAFNKAKAQLTSPCLLAHSDPAKRLILSCDASPFGIGAVMSHQFEDGVEKPIAFASHSLAPAERKYSHIEKEGLAVIYGVKRFHQYLWVPIMASGRIMRWALTLSAYEYRIEYRPAGNMGNADGLSQLPVEEAPDVVPLPGDVILMRETLADTDSLGHDLSTNSNCQRLCVV
eukprot:Em0013g449a